MRVVYSKTNETLKFDIGDESYKLEKFGYLTLTEAEYYEIQTELEKAAGAGLIFVSDYVWDGTSVTTVNDVRAIIASEGASPSVASEAMVIANAASVAASEAESVAVIIESIGNVVASVSAIHDSVIQDMLNSIADIDSIAENANEVASIASSEVAVDTSISKSIALRAESISEELGASAARSMATRNESSIDLAFSEIDSKDSENSLDTSEARSIGIRTQSQARQANSIADRADSVAFRAESVAEANSNAIDPSAGSIAVRAESLAEAAESELALLQSEYSLTASETDIIHSIATRNESLAREGNSVGLSEVESVAFRAESLGSRSGSVATVGVSLASEADSLTSRLYNAMAFESVADRRSSADESVIATGQTGIGDFTLSSPYPGRTPDSIAYKVTLTSSDSNAGVNFYVSGADQDGSAADESVVGPDVETVETTNYYKKIDRISGDASYSNMNAGIGTGVIEIDLSTREGFVFLVASDTVINMTNPPVILDTNPMQLSRTLFYVALTGAYDVTWLSPGGDVKFQTGFSLTPGYYSLIEAYPGDGDVYAYKAAEWSLV